MNQSEKQIAPEEIVDAEQVESNHSHASDTHTSSPWWIKLIVQPLILLACGAMLLAGLGVAQRVGSLWGAVGTIKQPAQSMYSTFAP